MDASGRLAARVGEIEPFHVMEVQTAARALEAAGRSVVHMEIGEPDFPTPQPVLDAAQQAIAHGHLHYTSALGLPELRAAIARHYAEHYGVDVAPGRVIVTTGSSAALLLVMALIVDRDDEILLADPGYPCNRHFVRVVEGAPAAIPVGPDTRYQLTARRIEEHWGAKTRGVLIASPSNPTGTTVPHDEMRRIAATVARLRGRLIVDEIYLGLTYGDTPRSVLEFADDAFVVSSFSKYFSMTGWRLGWIVAPERHVRDLEKLAQNLYISPAAPSQRAALACFEPATAEIVESRLSSPARFPRSRAARTRLRHSGHAEWRLFRLCRLLALQRRQRAVLPRSSRARRRGVHARYRLRHASCTRACATGLHGRRAQAARGRASLA